MTSTIIDHETGEVISSSEDAQIVPFETQDGELAARTDSELVALSEHALNFTLAQLSDTSLEDAPKMRAQTQALDKLLASHIRTREARLEAANNLTEARLRIERHTGALIPKLQREGALLSPSNTTLSRRSTASQVSITDYQITRDQSSLWQKEAHIPEDIFEDYVATGKENLWELSSAGLIWYARRGAEKQDAPPLPDGVFRVIYADPPWLYSAEQHGKAPDEYSKIGQDTVLASHYPSMPTEDICALPIRDIAADNAVLFIWTTSPKLFETADVIKAWGFTYKASIVWDKVKHNVGHYVSVRHEFLLIATRGSCLPDVKTLHDSVVSIERTEHSAKPPYFRELIDELYPPQGKDRIELFCRAELPDYWTTWGNEQ